ncbi:sugar phosphate isomerase/epimerase [Nocardiopsis sp. RSe5-2]|uniref:Sugar phosphate isomerase/epimerase n=1 Tax=Nocardiopsis endophytica TaxID=3018445 RepID=A0ABT4UAG5_9ACTN|nr:sugar phosphate isomerase/epimerase family protein [Nocardiopsis endophytica]MDA2813908.1 sugar phosphate isomerase/epimerase [Nocardiopsis endophytica]
MTWKFAFSTLGMPGAGVADTVRTAQAHGCHGIELRAHPDEEVRPGMPPWREREVRARIGDAGLEVACLAGYARVCAPGPDGPVVEELRALVRLAARLGAPSVRVFPGGAKGGGDGGGQEHDGRGGEGAAHERIGAVLPDLRDHGVRLLVETHDSHPTGEAALRLVQPFDPAEPVAVLWDALHPWRMGEAPSRTRLVLRDRLGYFQVKDAVAAAGGGWTPVPPGEGAVPIEWCASVLRGWSGWVSLEWERAWHPEIPPLPAALASAAEWFARWRPAGAVGGRGAV